jgi:hypothetical protein
LSGQREGEREGSDFIGASLGSDFIGAIHISKCGSVTTRFQPPLHGFLYHCHTPSTVSSVYHGNNSEEKTIIVLLQVFDETDITVE